jgi:hypothetical protein
MTSIYPINPSSGGGAPPPNFNGSNNGLVPNPGAGAADRVLNANGTWIVPPTFTTASNGVVPNPGAGASNRVLNANGTWAVPPGFAAQTIVLNPGSTSGLLGSITWSTNWTDPITLSTSVTMQVARMNSNIYATSLGATGIDTTISSAAAQMYTRNRWLNSVTSITFGLYSSNWNCDFYGTILANGSWFQIIGGASLNANNSDMLITKLT